MKTHNRSEYIENTQVIILKKGVHFVKKCKVEIIVRIIRSLQYYFNMFLNSNYLNLIILIRNMREHAQIVRILYHHPFCLRNL